MKGLRTFVSLATGLLLAGACSSDAPVDPADPDLNCVDVKGAGSTTGDRHKLRGDGTFTFGEAERPAQVGLYLFEMLPGPNGGLNVSTQYQFIWPDGDSFLTRDEVFFEPGLEPDQYRFTVTMDIVAGSGRFAGLIGKQPITLTATIQFGPPKNPGDPLTAEEQFTVGGRVCGDQW